jgi:signal recognition particle receptor subunit beta
MFYELKFAVLGDCGVGKSTFISRLCIRNFLRSRTDIKVADDFEKYVPTRGIKVSPIFLSTQYADFLIQLWELPGKDLDSQNLLDCCALAVGVLIFVDVTSSSSISRVSQVCEKLDENSEVLLCLNKSDLVSKSFRPPRDSPHETILVSSLYDSNLEEPLLIILRRVTLRHDMKTLNLHSMCWRSLLSPRDLRETCVRDDEKWIQELEC